VSSVQGTHPRPVEWPEGDASPARGVTAATLVASTLEWYGIFVYGTAAALVFGRLFFPAATPWRGMLLALSTYAVGFAARPVGGIVFGRLGDRAGRRPALAMSLGLTGLATVLIGCLPSAARIGTAAPVLLVLLRLVQGVGLGGQGGGAILLAVEHAPAGARGRSGAWPQAGAYAGLLLSTLAQVAALALTTDRQFLAWGWRLPFLGGILLVAAAVAVHRRLPESPAFAPLKEGGTEALRPVLEVARQCPRQIALATGMRVGESGAFYVFTVLALTLGPQRLGVPRATILAGVILATLLGLVTTPILGGLSDRVGRRSLYLTGAASLLLLAFPFFWLLETGSAPLTWLAIMLGVNVAHSLMYGPQAAWFSELFPVPVRYSGVSLGLQLGFALGGGLAPIATAWLAAHAEGASGAVAYLAVIALISFLSAWFTEETAPSAGPDGSTPE
jgi:MFS transporter, MHS family, shikimate and dehydroshikimate transport protein